MKPLTAQEIRGVWATLLIPLDDDGRIRWDGLAGQLARLVDSGVHGIYAHGTAGEFNELEEDEFDRINELLATYCADAGLPFQIGAGHASARTCLSRVRRARQWEPGAVQVVLPDWLPLASDECAMFLRRVAEAAHPVPVVLYNPPHAKTQVSPDLLEKLLAEIPSLIGVKMAGGDDAWFTRMRALAPRCSVFVAGHRLASGTDRGAHGSYSNMAAMSPAGAVNWYEMMHDDMPAALDVEHRIAAFFSRHIAPLQEQGLSNPALDKFLAAVGGWTDAGLEVRWPYRSASAAQVEAARRDAFDLLPDLMADVA